MAKRRRPQKRAGIRGLVIRAHGTKCALCGEECLYGKAHERDPLYLTIDHTLASSRGGDDHLGNLRPAHRRCNEMIGNLTDDELASGEWDWAV